MASLDDFCGFILGRVGRDGLADPMALAALFRERFRIQGTPSLARSFDYTAALGIAVEEVDYLPTAATSMRPLGKWLIHLSSHDPPATQKFSIFHEVFEIVAKSLADRLRVSVQWTERSADRFAAAVLMPPDFFWNRMAETGCDAVLLRDDLELSHQALLIGFAERLEEIAFAAALYDYAPTGASPKPLVGDFVAGLVVRTPKAQRLRRLSPRQWLPTRRGKVAPGSLACLAIKSNRPVLWRPYPGKDDCESGALATLVRPIPWGGSDPGRVVLLGLPDSHYRLIDPQVDRINPMRPSYDPEPCPAADDSLLCRSCPCSSWDD